MSSASTPPGRCQNGAVTIRDWWAAKGRAVEGKNARLAAAVREQGIAAARGLRDLSDDELIAQAQARTSFSYPYHEMEMQRRLKDAIVGLTVETTKARWWAFWGVVAIGVLTLVIIALTIVLALKA
jgi:hypothetical protein